MGKYSDFNIIPIGDHCAISMLLTDLNLRQKSYPFDWVTKIDHLHDTNIIYNIELINELQSSDNVDHIIKKYIGDAFNTDKKMNTTKVIPKDRFSYLVSNIIITLAKPLILFYIYFDRQYP